MKFVRRKEILLLKAETRNAKFGLLVSLGANKSISTDHFFSSSLANIPERGMKVETNEVLEPVTGRNEFIEGNSGQRPIEEESNTIKLSGSIRISMVLFVPLPCNDRGRASCGEIDIFLQFSHVIRGKHK